MKIDGKEVTKEWYNCSTFENILNELWHSNENKWRIGFTRLELLNEVKTGRFGNNIVATFSPKEGSVEIIKAKYKAKNKEWVDIQNLTYHYSWQNPKRNYFSHRKMLNFHKGRGDKAIYSLFEPAFKD